MRKIEPGRCGLCGTPVIKPREGETVSCGYINGHYFENHQLKKVRCLLHVERHDPRHPNFYDGVWTVHELEKHA